MVLKGGRMSQAEPEKEGEAAGGVVTRNVQGVSPSYY